MTDDSAAKPFVNTDIGARRHEYHFKPPPFILDVIRRIIDDERDLPIMFLYFNIIAVQLPLAAVLFLFPVPYIAGLIYLLVLYVLFFTRFVLALHYSSHRRLFKAQYEFLHPFISHILCPFMGIPPGYYYLHHCVMHHIENNVFPYDMSSTMPFQRDRVPHFVYYWFRFMFAGIVELPYYAFRRGRYAMCAKASACGLAMFAAVFAAYRFNAFAATFVLAVPFVITSGALMFGNFSQHIFVNPEKRFSNYGLTYNCVNVFENQITFNDGYHVVHHINSRLHWSQMPQNFMDNIQKYGEEDAITFQGIGFLHVGFYVFTGQLEKLARCFVRLPGQKDRSIPELVEMFRSRLVPLDGEPEKPTKDQ